MTTTSTRLSPFCVAIGALAVAIAVGGAAHAQSLEERTRREPGTNSLDNDSQRLQGDADRGTDSVDDDSQRLRGRTADQDGTNSLDNGSMDGNDAGGDDSDDND